ITLDGAITEYTVPTANSDPFGIAAGPDGNVWFTEYDGNQIGQLSLPLAAFGTTFTMTEGTRAKRTVANFRDTIPGVTAGSFTSTVDWGDGSTSAGTAVAVNGSPGSFIVNAAHTYADEGSHTVTITIRDNPNALVVHVYSAVRVTDAPPSGTGVTIAPTAGTVFDGIVANFRDGNPGGAI